MAGYEWLMMMIKNQERWAKEEWGGMWQAKNGKESKRIIDSFFFYTKDFLCWASSIIRREQWYNRKKATTVCELILQKKKKG